MLLARFLFQETSLFRFFLFEKLVGNSFVLFWFCLFFLCQRGVFCPTRPSPAGGSLTHSQALALSKRARDVTALRCSEPLRSKVGGASKPSPYFAGWDRLGTACFFPSPCFAGWDRLGIAGEGKKTVLICEICGTFKGKRICGTIMSKRNEIRRNNF